MSGSPPAGKAASGVPDTDTFDCSPAYEAGIEAARRCNISATSVDDPETIGRLVTCAVLKTAVPAIRKAERERWTRIEADPDQPGYNQGVFDLSGFAAAVVAEEREKIRAEERERCASLAESVTAEYVDSQPPGSPIGDGRYVHCFARLLREATDGKTAHQMETGDG